MRLSVKTRLGGHNGEHHARARSQNQSRSAAELPPAKLDPRRAPEAQPCPGGSNPRAVPRGTHTQTGRGSAERRSRARPVWVTMEISRRAVASTTERSDSSAGACCFKNAKTSDPSRPRASTTNGILLHRCNLKIFAKNRFEKSAIFVKIQQTF